MRAAPTVGVPHPLLPATQTDAGLQDASESCTFFSRLSPFPIVTTDSVIRPSWRPSLNTRKIRGCDTSTEWTESHSEHPLRAMPAALLRKPRDQDGSPIPLGRLHVHFHNRGSQTWMLVRRRVAARHELHPEPGPSCRPPQAAVAQEGTAGANSAPVYRREWVPARAGTKHPRLPGYVLHFLDRGEPSFVREASARNYAASKRKRERIAQTA